MQFRKITAAYFDSDTDCSLQKYNAVIRNTEAGGAYVGKLSFKRLIHLTTSSNPIPYSPLAHTLFMFLVLHSFPSL